MATPRKTSAAKKTAARKLQAQRDLPTASDADLLPGELPGAVQYRHPDTNERISRTEYVEIVRARRAAEVTAAWDEAVASSTETEGA